MKNACDLLKLAGLGKIQYPQEMAEIQKYVTMLMEEHSREVFKINGKFKSEAILVAASELELKLACRMSSTLCPK